MCEGYVQLPVPEPKAVLYKRYTIKTHKRAYAWAFTLFCESKEDPKFIRFVSRLKSFILPSRGASDYCPESQPWANYGLLGFEVCPKTARFHIQGYLQTTGYTRWDAVKRRLGCDDLHLEAARSSAGSNIECCKKSGDYEQFGVAILSGGTPAANHEKSGAVKTEILRLLKEENYGVDALIERYPTHLDFIIKINRLRHRRSGRAFCLYLYGSPGSGKTYSTEKVCKTLGLSLWKKCPGNKWFDGYEGQDVILFEEFTSCVTCSTFLSLCDSHPPLMEIKGGQCSISTPVYIFCTNISPEEQYPDLPVMRKKAFLRRLDRVVCTDDLHIVVEPPLATGSQNRVKLQAAPRENSHEYIENEIMGFMMSYHPKLDIADDGFTVDEIEEDLSVARTDDPGTDAEPSLDSEA